MGKKPAEPSPEAIARANRQRLAQEEGARAMADAEKRAVEVRQNMQRLRALREARDEATQADAVKSLDALPQAATRKRKKRIVR
ncbi:MAG: transcriptional regulator [Gemmatimonas sp.]|jgi:hypothetical protein